MSRNIRAYYRGKCRICGKQVEKGDMIWFRKYYGIRCQKCGPHTAADSRIPSRAERMGKKKPGEFKGRKKKKGTETPRKPLPMPGGDGTARRGPDRVLRYEYDCISDATRDAFKDYAQSDYNRTWINARIRTALSGNDDWCENYTKNRFLSELEHPRQDIMDAIDQLKKEIIDEIDVGTIRRRRIVRGRDYGDNMDVDRWAARNPNLWERNQHEHVEKRSVMIGCNIAISGNRRQKHLLYRGAAALALADVLTERGYNVGITLFESTDKATNTSGRTVLKYTVKEQDMPLDIGAIAYSLCSIVFARVVVFCGQVRLFPGKVRGGLGYPRELPARDCEGYDYIIEQDVLSKDRAVEWLKESIKKTETAAA